MQNKVVSISQLSTDDAIVCECIYWIFCGVERNQIDINSAIYGRMWRADECVCHWLFSIAQYIYPKNWIYFRESSSSSAISMIHPLSMRSSFIYVFHFWIVQIALLIEFRSNYSVMYWSWTRLTNEVNFLLYCVYTLTLLSAADSGEACSLFAIRSISASARGNWTKSNGITWNSSFWPAKRP